MLFYMTCNEICIFEKCGVVMENRNDIFDKIMKLPVLSVFEPFYKAYKEILLYIFFGGLTTVINIVIYTYLNINCGVNVLWANAIAWFFAVLFAFVTNRKWVFSAPTNNTGAFLQQIVAFYMGRVLSLLLEEGLLFVCITILNFNVLVVKIIAQIVVMIVNYIFSKIIVFRK